MQSLKSRRMMLAELLASRDRRREVLFFSPTPTSEAALSSSNGFCWYLETMLETVSTIDIVGCSDELTMDQVCSVCSKSDGPRHVSWTLYFSP